MNIPTKHGSRTVLPSFLSAGVAIVTVLTAMSSSAGIQGSGHRSVFALGAVTKSNANILVVDGASYSTSGATFLVDGQSGAAGQIHPGDVVSLTATDLGDGSTPAASQVTFSGSVRGKISGIDVPSATLFVLGQTVHVTSQTTFSSSIKPANLAGLQNGDAIEVSGFANSLGEWVATSIDAKGQSNVSRVVGSVQALDQTQHTFYINSLKVDYGDADVAAALANGASVGVQGLKFAADGALLASSVGAAGPVQAQPGSSGRFQGLITSYSSSAYFEVDGQPVTVTDQTKRNLPVPLGLDVQVHVSGTFDTNGVLVADSVQSSK